MMHHMTGRVEEARRYLFIEEILGADEISDMGNSFVILEKARLTSRTVEKEDVAR